MASPWNKSRPVIHELMVLLTLSESESGTRALVAHFPVWYMWELVSSLAAGVTLWLYRMILLENKGDYQFCSEEMLEVVAHYWGSGSRAAAVQQPLNKSHHLGYPLLKRQPSPEWQPGHWVCRAPGFFWIDFAIHEKAARGPALT